MTTNNDLDKRPNPPEPERDPGRGALPFGILSAVVAICFIVYGGIVFPNTGLSQWQLSFALMTMIYGLLTLVVLFCAYRAPNRFCLSVSQIAAAFYLLIYVAALTAGLHTVMGVSGILPVAIALWCNWFAINKVVRQEQ